MQELLLAIIAVSLVILTTELTIVLYYAIVFLREATEVASKAKTLEGNLETKINNLENDFVLFSIKIIKALFQKVKFYKK